MSDSEEERCEVTWERRCKARRVSLQPAEKEQIEAYLPDDIVEREGEKAIVTKADGMLMDT